MTNTAQRPRHLVRAGLRGLGGTLLAGVALVAFTPVPNVAAQRFAVRRDVAASDAIVVLGADIRRDGALGDASLRRAIAGIAEYKAGHAPRLMFLGSAHQGGRSEAAARVSMALQMGVPAAALLSDDRARTTREEADRSALALLPLGASSIILISDGLHLDRARRAFSLRGFQVSVAPVNTFGLDPDTPEGRMTLARSLAQQLLAWGLYQATASP